MSEIARYKNNSSPSTDADKIHAELRYFFNYLNVILYSLPLSKDIDCLILWKNGLHWYDIFEINLPKSVIFPTKLCTSQTVFGFSISDNIFIYVGFGSISLLLTTCPKNCLEDTLNAHFKGFSFILNLQKISKKISTSSIWFLDSLLLTTISSM